MSKRYLGIVSILLCVFILMPTPLHAAASKEMTTKEQLSSVQADMVKLLKNEKIDFNQSLISYDPNSTMYADSRDTTNDNEKKPLVYSYTIKYDPSLGTEYDKVYFTDVLNGAKKIYADGCDYLYDNILVSRKIVQNSPHGSFSSLTIYFSSFTYRMTQNSKTGQDDITAINRKAQEIVNSLHISDKSKLEKLKAIYGWFIGNCIYCKTHYDAKGHLAHASNDRYYSCYTAYAALFGTNSKDRNNGGFAGDNHEACCQGFAEAFQLVCAKAGVTVYVIQGRVKDGNTNAVPHTWNAVQLTGNGYDGYFFLDLTYDICKGNKTDWQGFLRGNSGNANELFSITNVDGTKCIYRKDFETGNLLVRTSNVDFSKKTSTEFVTPVRFNKVTKLSSTSSKISWIIGSSNASFVKVQYSTDQKTWKDQSVYNSTTKECTLKNLKSGTRYYIKLISIDSKKKEKGSTLFSFIA